MTVVRTLRRQCCVWLWQTCGEARAGFEALWGQVADSAGAAAVADVHAVARQHLDQPKVRQLRGVGAFKGSRDPVSIKPG